MFFSVSYISFGKTVLLSVVRAIPRTVLISRTQPKLSIWLINHVTKFLFSLLQEPKKNIERTFFRRSSGTENKAKKEVCDFSSPFRQQARLGAWFSFLDYGKDGERIMC